jgi:hypothetical protein
MLAILLSRHHRHQWHHQRTRTDQIIKILRHFYTSHTRAAIASYHFRLEQ